MTQEEKKILLADLCARLPYGLKVERNGDVCEVLGIIDDNIILTANVPTNQQTKVVNIKPYLRPISSMTEEEKEFLGKQKWVIGVATNGYIETTPEGFDWLNKKHFDYRGLIPKGLALEVKEGMYNTKQQNIWTMSRIVD